VHLLSCAPINITHLVRRTGLPPHRYGVMRGACLLVELSSPGGGGTRVPSYLAGDVIAYYSA